MNKINFDIKGNYVFIRDAPDKLLKGIDYETYFDLPEKYWMQKKMKQRRLRVNIEEIGRVHLFNKKYNCFPIGLIGKITEFVNDYNEYYKTNLKIVINDFRDKTVMQYTSNINYNKKANMKMRRYQVDSIIAFNKTKSGILQMPTGSGKTYVATELIKIYNTRTLWICDRKELLTQTKHELETLLGIKIGIISGTKVETDNLITIATIQSLRSKLSTLYDFLYNINFAIVDEYHKSAAESYQKVFAKIPNTSCRLGLTATPYRDDGKTPILQSILGDIVYKITTQELINQGFLVRPTIKFISLQNFDTNKKQSYPNDYKENIVENVTRNDLIKNIVERNYDKKILILTKLIDHGTLLQELLSGSQYIHGQSKDRELIMDNFRKGIITVLIMTQSIGKEGLDIPDLDIIINAAANKGDVASIQVLGRVLRIFKDKKNAVYYDFIDIGKHTYKHSMKRISAFEEDGHKVIRETFI